MRFTPQLRQLNWLMARPVAHRGLHNAVEGLVENCESAFAAALKHNYAIECDLQRTADGEAIVFHDDEVERLLQGSGRVRDFTTKQLKAMSFKHGKDRVQTLGELLEQVDGRATLVIELKSHWDDDFTLTDRALEVLRRYQGPFGLMSFDPDLISRAAARAPQIVRGITADRAIDPSYNTLPLVKRLALRSFAHMPQSRPHFVSFDYSQLPFQPITAFHAAGFPILTWTIRSEAAAKQASRWSDQITFENFTPA